MKEEASTLEEAQQKKKIKRKKGRKTLYWISRISIFGVLKKQGCGEKSICM